MDEQKKITRKELDAIAREKGVKNYLKYNRFELAEKGGIELPRPKLRQKKKQGKHVRLKFLTRTERQRRIRTSTRQRKHWENMQCNYMRWPSVVM